MVWKYNRKPTSPGEILSEEFIKPMGLTQKNLADHMGMDVKVINRICNEKSSITPAVGVKLASTFGTSAEFWLNAQTATDLWKLKESGIKLPKKIQISNAVA